MEYIQGLDGQISVFLHSLGIGFLLGVFYDAVCAVRAVLPGGRKVIFVTDILYVIVCAFASFCFILVLNDGRTLLYILAAQLLGWIAERLSLGAAAKHLGLLISSKLRKLFWRIKDAVSKPLCSLKEKISQKLTPPGEKDGIMSNKNEKNMNYLLKKGRNMLYTLNRQICPKARKQKVKGKRKNVGKKRRLKKRHSTILMIVFAVAVCYFLISFIVMQSDIKSQEKYNAQLRTQLADKKAENEELEKLVKSSDLDDYVEQIARRELGYVFPDERVYYNEQQSADK